MMGCLAMMMRGGLVVRSRFMVRQPAHASDFGHVLSVAAYLFPAAASDLRHMLAVLAYCLAALAPGFRMALRVSVPAPAFPFVSAALPTLRAAIIVILMALTSGFCMLFARAAPLTVCHCSVPFWKEHLCSCPSWEIASSEALVYCLSQEIRSRRENCLPA
jgi:hypothetical protein